MSNNVVKSICYLECVNKITSLVNELLYSADKGYIYLKSRDAIFGFEKVI